MNVRCTGGDHMIPHDLLALIMHLIVFDVLKSLYRNVGRVVSLREKRSYGVLRNQR